MSMSSKDFNALVVAAKDKFSEVAPTWLSVERIVRLAIAARSRSPALAECSSDSYLLFLMRCAETGLEPIGAGGAWAVPYWNRKVNPPVREVQFIPDWRGLIQLAKRTGQIKHAYGEVVCANDKVSYQKGDTPHIAHEPNLTNRGDMIGAYCVVILPDDSRHIEYMNKTELDAIRNRSKSGGDGPWATDYGQMAIKTVVKRALKPFAASPEMQTAIAYDNEVTGLAMPDRTPIAEPKAIAPAAAEELAKKPAPEQSAEGQQPPPKRDPENQEGEVVKVTVGDIKTKTGSTRGKEWCLYYFSANGDSYSTFDTNLADILRGLNGQEAELRIERTAKGINVLGIQSESQDVSEQLPD